MAAESSQRATSSYRSGWKYDVFLSFRGETRLGFTDHLHSALQSKGIIVFRDEEKLERGRNIRPTLWKAIQESEYKVIVISKNYASSTWCLDELIEIVKCKRDKVLPVFYDVDPSDVRKQKKSFATAFAEHTENKVDEKQMNMWRDALKEVCKLAGWDVRGRHESEVVKQVCGKIFYGLSRPLLDIDDDLVGIESKTKELMNLLCMKNEDENVLIRDGDGDEDEDEVEVEDEDVCVRDKDVRFLGIWGMGGVGKTTLAEVIYNRVSHRFDGRCFISNVREKSGDLIRLQQQLISQILEEEESLICKKICNISGGKKMIASMFQNKKVFIVLDDVDKENQLEALAGKTDWFGKGSRILLTSRDNRVFKRHVDKNGIYKVEELSYYDALRLFHLKAFNKHCYEKSYTELSKDVVKHARGLPLALRVFASFLLDCKADAWKSALDRLKACAGFDILDRLKISFEGLDDIQQRLFLDIACFFKGMSINDVTYKLKALGHFPEIDIPILESKSLIKISNINKLEMHDLLQEMGHRIVHLESSREPGKRSRLWYYEDIIYMLNNNTGTDAIEAIFLKLPLPRLTKLSFEGFSRMKKLRMLIIRPINFDKYYIGNDDAFEYLSTVEWNGDPAKFMLSNKLRVLEWWGYPLEYLPTDFEPNNLVQLRMPISSIKQLWDATKNFDKLKYIDLSDSQNLIEMPDINEVPHLEELNVKGSRIRQLSSSIVLQKNLSALCVGGSFLRPITFSLPNLSLFSKSLRKLELVYCDLSDGVLPSDLGCLSLVEHLDLSGNNFTRIDGLSQLSKLWFLMLDDCNRLEELSPKLSFRLFSVSLRNCPSLNTFSNPRDIWSSSEVLVAGGSSVVANYFGYNGRRDRTLYLARPYRGSKRESPGTELTFRSLSWGPTLTSDIPEWFNKRSASLPDISGMFRCQIDFDMFDGRSTFNEGIVLFIVYEVFEFNSCERKRETQKIDECENPSSRIFPVFDLELQVNKDDVVPIYIGKPEVSTIRNVSIVIRVPEVPSIGRNGVWVIVSRGCFSLRYFFGSCSITISSPNVLVRECGVHILWNHLSGCYEIIRSISPHDLASESRENGFFMGRFCVYGPIKRARAGRLEEEEGEELEPPEGLTTY